MVFLFGFSGLQTSARQSRRDAHVGLLRSGCSSDRRSPVSSGCVQANGVQQALGLSGVGVQVESGL